jgi:N-acyl amino acid synthase FeeM
LIRCLDGTERHNGTNKATDEVCAEICRSSGPALTGDDACPRAGSAVMSQGEVKGFPAEVAAVAGPQPDYATGLHYRVAADLVQVADAWRLVYMAYRRINIIPPNAQRLHLVPQALSSQTAVVIGCAERRVVSTLTVIVDGNRGLPLDRVYGDELNAMRQNGAQLVEVGMFADRRQSMARTAEALLQLMCFAWYWGHENRVTDFIIGVHPRHARFYARLFGFHIVAGEKRYAAFNDNPVVLLVGNPAIELARDPIPPGLTFFLDNPVPADAFAGRCRFTPEHLERLAAPRPFVPNHRHPVAAPAAPTPIG